MAPSSGFPILPQLRAWCMAASTALLLAGCGGGGGGGGAEGDIRYLEPGTPAIVGSWELTVTEEGGAPTPPLPVTASAVPASEDVSQLTTAEVVDLIATTSFQGYRVTVNGNAISVTDTDTNYVLVVNSFSASGFRNCGTCLVGTTVSFTLTVNYSESGELDGRAVPAVTGTVVLRVDYRRTA